MSSELRLLTRYVRELRHHVEAVVGSLAILILVWLLDKLGPAWWATPKPWVYVLIASVGLVIAQYLTWRSLLRKEEAPNPEVGDGLTLEYERPTIHRTGFHVSEVEVRFRREVQIGKEVHVLCSAPIIGGETQMLPDGRAAEFKVLRPTRGAFTLRRAFAAGDTMDFQIYGNVPIALRSIQLVEQGKAPSF